MVTGFNRPRGVDVDGVVADGIAADLAGSVRACCDCRAAFTGPGPRCPVCVQQRDTLVELEGAVHEAIGYLSQIEGPGAWRIHNRLRAAIKAARA